MAKIVLGLGSAHSPMLSLGGDRWSEYGERDQANPMLAAVPGGARAALCHGTNPRLPSYGGGASSPCPPYAATSLEFTHTHF